MRTIERERRRIEAAFCAALVAASAVAVVEACSSSGDGASGSPDASSGFADATAGETSDTFDASSVDGGVDAAVGVDAPSCAPTFYILDGATLSELGAMPDADLCALIEPCGLPPGITTQGCLVIETQQDGTPIPDSGFGCNVSPGNGCVNGAYVPVPGPSVDLTCACELFIQGGRRTGRTRRRGGERGATPLGAFLGAMACEEAASVEAFERLAAELSSHGAPASLVRAASQAQRDEARHAAVMARLAKRAKVAVSVRARPVRSLEAMAKENAVEGCVRETFAALLACWQAEHADDPEVRAAFVRIARDETRHAALAWTVAAWAHERLPEGARRRVARARRAAVEAVARSLGYYVDASLTRRVGLPRPSEARALFAEMARVLEV
jgi:hypothetical protein